MATPQLYPQLLKQLGQ
jgi:hypothetical protein